jgi:hypothetical protein
MPMDVTALLRTALRRLETERDRVDRQMGALRTVLDSNVPTKVSGRRRPMTAATRRVLSRRMKAYWAARKAATQGRSTAAKKAG